MLSGLHPLNQTPLGESEEEEEDGEEEWSLLALARSEWERGEEKVLGQHNGLLFCWVRQYRRLSCQPRGDTIDLVMGGGVGGYTPCCFNLLASSTLI